MSLISCRATCFIREILYDLSRNARVRPSSTNSLLCARLPLKVNDDNLSELAKRGDYARRRQGISRSRVMVDRNGVLCLYNESCREAVLMSSVLWRRNASPIRTGIPWPRKRGNESITSFYVLEESRAIWHSMLDMLHHAVSGTGTQHSLLCTASLACRALTDSSSDDEFTLYKCTIKI